MNVPREKSSDGRGGEDEGIRRLDDCIEELSFGGGNGDDDNDDPGVGRR